ncbi:MAG: hypothetical protein N4A45_06165 [Flavobacteriales bacterium]|jgi:hypothetical protein|nr:hypothetical protein [Flavobacteriales bacterium]
MKYFLFPIITLFFILSSCSKPDLQEEIVGKWNLISVESNSVAVEADACISQTNWTFSDNGNLDIALFIPLSPENCVEQKQNTSWILDAEDKKLSTTINQEATDFYIFIENDVLTINGELFGNIGEFKFKRN